MVHSFLLQSTLCLRVRHQVGSTLTVRGRLAFPRELGRSHAAGVRMRHHRGYASLRRAVGVPSPAGVGFPHMVVFCINIVGVSLPRGARLARPFPVSVGILLMAVFGNKCHESMGCRGDLSSCS